jgi:hypothetical protein
MINQYHYVQKQVFGCAFFGTAPLPFATVRQGSLATGKKSQKSLRAEKRSPEKRGWSVEEYHRSVKQNASFAKSPTRTITT